MAREEEEKFKSQERELETMKLAAIAIAKLAGRMYASFGSDQGSVDERLAFADNVIGGPEVGSDEKSGYRMVFSLPQFIPDPANFEPGLVEMENRRRVERLLRMVSKIVVAQDPFTNDVDNKFLGAKRKFDEVYSSLSGQKEEGELIQGGKVKYRKNALIHHPAAMFTIVTGNPQLLLASVLAIGAECMDLGVLESGSPAAMFLGSATNLALPGKLEKGLRKLDISTELIDQLARRREDSDDPVARKGTVRDKLQELARGIEYFIEADPTRLVAAGQILVGDGFNSDFLPDGKTLEILAAPGREILKIHWERQIHALIVLAAASGLTGAEVLNEAMEKLPPKEVVKGFANWVEQQTGVDPKEFLREVSARLGTGPLAFPPGRALPPKGRQDIGGASPKKEGE